MRLISQNGEIDVPYESVAVALNNMNKRQIICFDTKDTQDKCWKLGEYNTEENAKKAMKLLKMEFIEYGDSGYFEFPQDEEV